MKCASPAVWCYSWYKRLAILVVVGYLSTGCEMCSNGGESTDVRRVNYKYGNVQHINCFVYSLFYRRVNKAFFNWPRKVTRILYLRCLQGRWLAFLPAVPPRKVSGMSWRWSLGDGQRILVCLMIHDDSPGVRSKRYLYHRITVSQFNHRSQYRYRYRYQYKYQ